MESCTIEAGLLRKKPCGHPATTHCLNCERPLCSQHAVAQLTEAGKHSGKFLCKECQAAWKDIEKTKPTAPVAKKPAEKPGEKPAVAPAHAKAPAPKEEPAKPAAESSGAIEFTPTKKP